MSIPMRRGTMDGGRRSDGFRVGAKPPDFVVALLETPPAPFPISSILGEFTTPPPSTSYLN